MRTLLLRTAAPLHSHSITPGASRMSLFRPCARLHNISKSSRSQFSIQSQRQNANENKPPLPKNPSYGAASFKELGATRTVKVVVYVAIGIIATVETVTYTRFLWAKFGPKPKVEGE